MNGQAKTFADILRIARASKFIRLRKTPKDVLRKFRKPEPTEAPAVRHARIMRELSGGQLTAAEIASRLGVDEKTAANRLSALPRFGLIEGLPIARDTPGRCRVAWRIAA